MVPVLAFDIETIPDTAGLAKLYALPVDTPADEVAEIAFQRRRASTGSDFLQLHVHRVLVISCALRSDEGFRVWSLSGEDEAANVQRFFEGIEKYTPQLVSWNGGGFDLPVLHYRAMVQDMHEPEYHLAVYEDGHAKRRRLGVFADVFDDSAVSALHTSLF